MSVDSGAEWLTQKILCAAEKCIPKGKLRERKSTHPWINDRVIELTKKKHDAAGTEEAHKAHEECSAGIKEEYAKYIDKERKRLKDEPRASKGWWSRSRRLLGQKGKTCSIPALKKSKKEWCMDAKSKADHLADTFKSKYTLPEAAHNYYSEIGNPGYGRQEFLADLKDEQAEKILDGLREDSATGPDLLPAKVLKKCARYLSKPICKLARKILTEGRWPEIWVLHWIVPLHKRRTVFLAANYRGVHLTSQLSKVMERLLRHLFKPYVLRNGIFGCNQFAYTPERGARDALANLVITWIMALAKRRKVAIYCSDVSGAFDRVRLERLAAKLKAKKIHPKIIDVLVSWLRNRRARVVVGGETSEEIILENMVFQGTVFGPDLWNIFYEDAREAIKEMHYEENVFADDLNAYRIFPETRPNEKILESLKACQRELHSWGEANQVQFDAGKEGLQILSLNGDAYGEDFKILGVIFDVELSMRGAVDDLATAASWKLKMLLRTRRFYSDAELIVLYKAHLLSFVEYRTPAIYHATREVLRKIDRIQTKFVEDAGVSEQDALM
jgi:hypothetical protein